jgi:tetratricopeptide (TPR) repeat protein
VTHSRGMLVIRAVEVKGLIGTIDVSKNENYNRGIELYDQGLYTESIAAFERVLESSDDCTPEHKFASFYMCEAYANLGLTHLRMNMYRRAEKELKLALVLHPDYADLHCCLAVTCYKQGRYDEAETHLKKAAKINPEYSRALMYLGMTRLRRGNVKGLDDIAKAMSLEPSFRSDKYDRVVALYESGDLDRCLQLVEEIAETDTDHISMLLNKGLNSMNTGDYQEATRDFLDAVSISPQYADVRHYLGLCYLNQDMVDLAIGQFRKSLDINPSFKAARLSLAGAYVKAGKTDAAMEELHQVLALDPGNVEATAALMKLRRHS